MISLLKKGNKKDIYGRPRTVKQNLPHPSILRDFQYVWS
ncbi:hypothetical Protein YC6258_05834 [Gynuella sunshinyii YC6258]|uniref:Uncharacterized protein n=1 Tax=Gynuella sunshinyii YC6258 TaxID=1445510 RepID=A0A0C5VT65_9GAMM|nr:hypothetical Protein YC6258_05834 [Gynuella sunshinyii YC6258]